MENSYIYDDLNNKSASNSKIIEYTYKINNIIKYIDNNLDKTLDLNELSKLTGFSKYHFHRIFKDTIGKTVNDYINKKRLEKAKKLIINNPQISITDIAFSCGFNSSSWFIKSFKKHVGCNPSEWKRKSDNQISIRHNLLNSSTIEHNNIEEFNKIRIKELPAFHVAYISPLGGYTEEIIRTIISQFHKWQLYKGFDAPENKILCLFYDSPFVTPVHKCRYSICMTIPRNIVFLNEMDIIDIKSSAYAVYCLKMKYKTLEDVFEKIKEITSTIMVLWIYKNDYKTEENKPIIFQFNEDNYKDKIFCAEICIPIKDSHNSFP